MPDWDAPDEPMVATRGRPRVSVFILPNCESAGMLETLYLSAVQDVPAMPCVEQYLQCLEVTAKLPPNNPEKARAHAFLASRPRPELRVGEAGRSRALALGFAGIRSTKKLSAGAMSEGWLWVRRNPRISYPQSLALCPARCCRESLLQSAGCGAGSCGCWDSFALIGFLLPT